MTIGPRSDARLRNSWMLAPLAILLITSLTTSRAGAAAPVAGSQGTDTSLPATDSQVTVRGRDAFANLAITVNQTASLTNQAVSITWTGGTPTIAGPGRFGSHYLQIFQCWGDDDGSVPSNPGPPPEQCEQGAVAGTPGGLPGSLYPGTFAMSRIVSRSDWANFDRTVGYLDAPTTNVWLPFRAVDGTVVNTQADVRFNPAIGGGHYWLNPYFNIITTNEIVGAVTGPGGRGAELFQVLTGSESSGLGCGQKTQPTGGGGKKIPKCWIVGVPRGTPTSENVGTPFDVNADQTGVNTSPLSREAWKHRVAIPIDFNPVDSPCTLGADERRISGSELAHPAVASWQPALCGSADLAPYSYAPVSDNTARQQLESGQPGSPGMVVVSQPLSPDSVDPANPVVYAPISASGIVIGFNIERYPRDDAPPPVQQLSGVRVADLNLTPRLVAKLLTQSYRQAVDIGGHAPGYPWLAANPSQMNVDPDFLQFNPEFQLLGIQDGRTFSGLQLPAGSSDAAHQVWQWILADPEARAWLNGQPDPWGMKVNTVYATDAAANSTGVAFGYPPPSSFPKADPYCYHAPAQGPGNSIVPTPLCGTDWMPYHQNFADAAQVTRVAADRAKIEPNPIALSSSDAWTREPSQFLGRRAMLALTDSPSAAKFGLQSARLSRAGDNGADRTFIAPDNGGLTAGVAAMAPGDVPSVLEPSPTTSAPGAYPLTALAYAAIAPLALDQQARDQYAAFIDYATGPGQVPGLKLGQLPKGYAPLSDILKLQADVASFLVRHLVALTPDTTVSTILPTTTVASSPPTVSPTEVPTEVPTEAPTTTTTPRRIVRPRKLLPSPPVTFGARTTSDDATTSTEATTTTDAATTTAQPTTTTTATTPLTDKADEPTSTSPSVFTPIVHLAGSRFAVPALGGLAVGSGLVALEITKRPRRRRIGGPDASGGPDESDPH